MPTLSESNVVILSPFNPETGEPAPSESVPKPVLIQYLREAIDLMNDGGRHWIQNSYVRPLVGGGTGYCAVGAIATTVGFRPDREAILIALTSELLITLGEEPRCSWHFTINSERQPRAQIDPSPIINFNDTRGRTWREVKSLFESTIERLEKEVDD